MDFFNSRSTRIPLAIIGGILYSALTHQVVILLNPPSGIAIFAAIIIFLFYLGSRFTLLFSGVDTPYYSKGERIASKQFYENTLFHQTAQWVGKFYHYHDIALFIFLVLISIVFLVSLIIDWAKTKPLGNTIQNFWNTFLPLP